MELKASPKKCVCDGERACEKNLNQCQIVRYFVRLQSKFLPDEVNVHIYSANNTAEKKRKGGKEIIEKSVKEKLLVKCVECMHIA